MNRGDIWLVNIGGRAGTIPAVILTREKVIPYLNKITAAEVTTKGKGYPTEVFIGQKANLPKTSFVQTDNIHTVSKQRLVRYLGTPDPAAMRKISQKIIMALELEDCG